jgi:hypothetical protein
MTHRQKEFACIHKTDHTPVKKSQITSTKLFTLLNNSINGVTVLVMKITWWTYSENPYKTI